MSTHATVHIEGASTAESGADDGEFICVDAGAPLVELSFLLKYENMRNQQD